MRNSPAASAAGVLAAVAAGLVAGEGRARAEVIYDIAPSATAGYTTNARLTGTPMADWFGILAVAARARYLGARTQHSLAYRVGWTHFLEGNGIDNLTNEIALLTTLNPTPTTQVNLNANAIVSRMSRVDLGNPTLGTPQAITGGTNLYLTLGAAEEIIYQPNARWRYIEGLGVTRITYLDAGAPPSGMVVTARGRSELLDGRDTYSLEATATATLSLTDNLLMQLLAGWRREFSITWTGELQVGAMAVLRENGPTVFGPAAIANLNYRNNIWFALLSLARVPTANLFLGQPTVNNQALLRLTLPLRRDEMFVIIGSAGYVYANLAEDQLTRAFDQQTAAVVLGARFGRLPLYGSLEYSAFRQRNNPVVPTIVPSLTRQVIMLNLTASFTFGPGTPPILGAPM